jgi:general stress protein 26
MKEPVLNVMKEPPMSQADEIAKTRESRVIELLSMTVNARLGTANPKTLQPHVVPVWFLWDGESIWISAFSSTRKVKDLVRNRRCSVLIEPSDPGNSSDVRIRGLQAVLLEGACELIAEQPFVADMSQKVYEKYLGPEGVKAKEPQSWKIDPENRIVKLTPEKVYIW